MVDQLNEGLQAPLSIICGIAGSGKTSLARDWSASLGAPSAWISLDAADNDLPRFADVIAAASSEVCHGVGQALVADLALQPNLAPADLAISLADEILAFSQDVILILDDFQAITSLKVYAIEEALLRFPPPNLHLCIVTRIDPPLQLVRYRTRFAFTEIRLARLLFSKEETATFLERALPSGVSEETVASLQDRTEGWIAGLQLAALAIRQESSEERESIDLRHRALADSINYIGDEIVQRQPPDVKSTLMKIAVPERIAAGLVSALLEEGVSAGQAQQLLDGFEESGLFLRALGDDRQWFRFHPLFRTTLLERFEREADPRPSPRRTSAPAAGSSARGNPARR